MLFVVFTVGLAAPETTDFFGIQNANFSKELLSKTKIFHFQGDIDYEKLGYIHKIMMLIVKKFRVDRKRSEERTDENRAFLETYGKKVDFVNQSAIKPLIDYVRKLLT
ncbi:MAG: flavodoxin domain-containing protein [Synergistaceae bacterium]|nr:flavodoxin domain-containing protein [Synergistaceae bacterium]